MRIAHPLAPFSLAAPRTAVSTRLLAIVALVAANIIWGTTFVATRPVLERVPPLTLASARLAIALLVLLPVLLLSGHRPILHRTTALMGFVGVFLAYACQNLGLMHTDASNGAIIHGSIPVITMLLAAPVLGERVDARRATGIALSLAGVVAVVLHGSGGLGMSALGGVAVFGLLFMIPASAVEIATVGVDRPTTGEVLDLVYPGVAASGLAFVLWGYGLRHMEAGQAASCANLNPLVGVVFAALLPGETISPLQLAGGAAILAGVWLTSRRETGPSTLTAARALLDRYGGQVRMETSG